MSNVVAFPRRPSPRNPTVAELIALLLQRAANAQNDPSNPLRDAYVRLLRGHARLCNRRTQGEIAC